jgi:ketosteroid isomerase-like protein
MTTSQVAGGAAFVERFAEAWSDPSPDGLMALMAPDVVLRTPAMPPVRGLDQVRSMWTALFAALPDLRGDVHRWAATDDGGLIELTLSAKVARRRFAWALVDRVVLTGDGRIRERVSYFDPLPLVVEMLKAPRRWPAFARMLRPT